MDLLSLGHGNLEWDCEHVGGYGILSTWEDMGL